MKKSLLALAILLVSFACSKDAPATASSSASAAPAPKANQLAGTVVETFNGGGYTYLRIDTGSGEQWAAVPEAAVTKGQKVTLDVQMMMDDFESKSLNRKFEHIAFASMGGAAAPSGGNASPMQHMQAPDLGAISIEQPAGGTSIADVYKQKNALAGKEVVVRGRVVKSLAGIMGTNWMHLQDGTGSKATGDHDLTVTTDGVANVGDVVTVKGTLAVDKDFGSGYRYAVIVEKATVSK